MAKQIWKPGNMIYPLPAVMVSVTDGEGNDNIITVAWTGTVCTNPAMAYISVRPSRYSYGMLKKTGEFVINLTTEKLAFATDFCGVRSGRDVDKFEKLNLTKEKAQYVSAPMIGEAPVSIECRVREVKELGSHDMFLADVLAVHADEAYMDKNNKFHLNDAGLLVYSHGEYLAGGRKVGTFGYSVKKKNGKKKRFMNFFQLCCKSSFLIFQSCDLLCVGSNLGLYFGNFFVQYFYFGTSLSHMKPPDKILLLIQ